MNFPALVAAELKRARAHHPRWTSPHQGYALILEELEELWEEVRENENHHNPRRMLNELVQVAATAQRMAEDVVAPLLPPKS